MKVNISKLNRFILDFIIVLESLLIGLSYYWPIQSTKYLLFSIVGLSIYFGIISLNGLLSRFPRVSITLLFYLVLIIVTLIYTGLIRNKLPTAIIFISSVMFLMFLYINGMSKSSIIILIICNISLTLLNIFEYLKLNDSNLFYQNLKLAYGNPNMAGIVIYSTLMILITGAYFVGNRFYKITLIILSVCSFYLLLGTHNRGSIVAVLVLILLLFIYKKGSRINNTLRSVLLFFPLIFALLYLGLVLRLPSMGEFLGKPIFSDRAVEWKYLMNTIANNPFSLNELPSGGLNLFLAGIIDYGVIAFGSYIVLLFIIKPGWTRTSKLNYKQVAYLAFLCVFIQQTFESTLISGSYGIYINNYLLLGIACSENTLSQDQE